MDGGPPYRRIVDDIRRRIVTGQLGPGDRVPSARQIVREWGVAIATATRALGDLQREGLVRAIPGVGTVVADESRPPSASAPPSAPSAPPAQAPATPAQASPAPAPAPAPAEAVAVAADHGQRGPHDEGQALHRDVIVRAAIAIADAEGLAAVSMRRIAADLGTATMSLYRHVPGKDELVLFMIDQALGEDRLPEGVPDGWRVRLELSARAQWAVFRRHPWLAPAMSVTRPQLVPNALAHTDWILSALDGLGLDATAMLHFHVTLFSFVRGLATNFEAEAQAEQDTGMTSDEWMLTQEPTMAEMAASAGSGPLATFLRVVGQPDIDLDLETLFEFGLARLLDGLEAFLIRSER